MLNKAREKTRGYPRALEALYAILSVDRYTTLEELLELSLPDEVVQKLVGEAFNRLDPSAQKVMQALAVYNRPVSPAAIDYLLQPHLPSIDSALVLNRLVNMHFARREAGRYYLHPADKEYAFSLIENREQRLESSEQRVENSQSPTTNLQSLIPSHLPFTQHDLLNRAADYFAQARKPRAEWKKLDDLTAQLAEFDLRCAAGDYDTAASVLDGIDTKCLLFWGHYRLMINLHEKLQGKVNDKDIARRGIGNIGLAFRVIGNVGQAILSYEKALAMARESKNRQAEGTWLGNLGSIYSYLGDTYKAIEFHEQALIIDREVGDREGEGVNLGNLGNRFVELGDARKAIEFYQQAFLIDHEISNRRGEAYDSENTGHAWLSLENYQLAKDSYLQSIQIADELSLPMNQLSARWGLAQAYLFQNDLVNARATIEAALQYDVPENNHNVTALHGIIALRQGERETAQVAFTKSIVQADEILAKTPEYYSALDAKGLALCGLALCARDDGRQTADHGQSSTVYRQQAIETFRKARKIAPHAGIVKANLRLFDELMKCEGREILKDVRNAVEGVE